MYDNSTTAVPISAPCVHAVDVKIIDGQVISYCTKCGMIFSVVPLFSSASYQEE